MEIKVPAVGESVFEALLAKWHKADGERVEKDQPVCEIETDKITLEINAEVSGILSIGAKEGETVKIGAVIGQIEEQGAAAAPPAASATGKGEAKAEQLPPPLSPAGRKMALEKGIRPETIQGSGKGGRVTVDDLLKPQQEQSPQPTLFVRSEEPASYQPAEDKRTTRQKMTPIRKRIAERLVVARQQTAMLTTFNEADMSRVMDLRRRQQEHFQARHGIKLGLMSFFVKASVEALKEFPLVNARIDGNDIVYQHFYDIGIAVASERGLVVPVCAMPTA